MKKIVLCIALCVFMTGCVPSFLKPASYFTDPNSPGYHVSEFGGNCTNCAKDFTFSMHQLENEKTAKCPFCGAEQNLEEASKRYANKYVKVSDRKK